MGLIDPITQEDVLGPGRAAGAGPRHLRRRRVRDEPRPGQQDRGGSPGRLGGDQPRASCGASCGPREWAAERGVLLARQNQLERRLAQSTPLAAVDLAGLRERRAAVESEMKGIEARLAAQAGAQGPAGGLPRVAEAAAAATAGGRRRFRGRPQGQARGPQVRRPLARRPARRATSTRGARSSWRALDAVGNGRSRPQAARRRPAPAAGRAAAGRHGGRGAEARPRPAQGRPAASGRRDRAARGGGGAAGLGAPGRRAARPARRPARRARRASSPLSEGPAPKATLTDGRARAQEAVGGGADRALRQVPRLRRSGLHPHGSRGPGAGAVHLRPRPAPQAGRVRCAATPGWRRARNRPT